jgi:hypothetical protein
VSREAESGIHFVSSAYGLGAFPHSYSLSKRCGKPCDQKDQRTFRCSSWARSKAVGAPRDVFPAWGQRGHTCVMEECRWSMASSQIDNHGDRSHNPATLTRQGRKATCLEDFPALDAGRVRLQNPQSSSRKLHGDRPQTVAAYHTSGI